MADAVTHWNDVLLEVIRRQVGTSGTPGPVTRGGAMMHGAIYDAVNSIRPSTHRPYLVSVPASPGTSVRAAIAHAAHDTLVVAFPSQAPYITAERIKAINELPATPNVGLGEVVGKAAAAAMIAARTGDGADDMSPYTPGNQRGDWRPTTPGPKGEAVTPYWSDVKPFGIPAGNAFRPPPPGGYLSKSETLRSIEYAAQLNEVKTLGRFDSTKRTAEQEEIAFFWANELDGTYKPPGQLFDITKTVSEQKGLGIVANARLFALAALAMADAAIVAWDAKYETSLDLWRPETAIQLADTSENPATSPDTAWKPLSRMAPPDKTRFSPPFPAYVSGHATLGAAHAAVMRRALNTDNVTFTVGTEDPNAKGVTRTFNSFTEAALEDARSRVYLGVHYQWDGDNGFLSGTAAGNYIYDNVLTPIGS
jgi:hypothetical protein